MNAAIDMSWLPEGWGIHRLEDIAEIASGLTKGRKFNGRNTTRLPYLRVANVQAGYIDTEDITEIEVPVDEIEKYRLFPGDVVMTEGGDPDKLGRGGIWQGAIDPCLHQNHIFRVRAQQDVLHAKYLDAYLGSWIAKGYFLRCAKQTTGIASINKTQLRALPVALPPLPEQRRIAVILARADAIRSKRQEAIRLTEEFLRSVFLEMFGDPAANPKGWSVSALSVVADITTGNTPSRKQADYYGDGIEWIKSDNINTPSHVLTPAAEHLSKLGQAVGRVAPAGSTLMTCIAGSRGCIGNVALADREVAFNQQINALSAKDGIDPHFLYMVLLVGKRLVQAASTDAMKGMVSKGRLSAVKIPVPPPSEQEKFGSWFVRFLQCQLRLERARDEANTLFNSLVQLAFRGEL